MQSGSVLSSDTFFSESDTLPSTSPSLNRGVGYYDTLTSQAFSTSSSLIINSLPDNSLQLRGATSYELGLEPVEPPTINYSIFPRMSSIMGLTNLSLRGVRPSEMEPLENIRGNGMAIQENYANRRG